jgi:hypothetical protein
MNWGVISPSPFVVKQLEDNYIKTMGLSISCIFCNFAANVKMANKMAWCA